MKSPEEMTNEELARALEHRLDINLSLCLHEAAKRLREHTQLEKDYKAIIEMIEDELGIKEKTIADWRNNIYADNHLEAVKARNAKEWVEYRVYHYGRDPDVWAM